MSVAASGHLGAGAATVQASCVTGAAKITPVDATKMWDSTENFWVYYDLTVAGDFHTCLPGDKVLIVVFVPGSSPTTVAAEYALSSSDTVANASFIVTLKTATSGKPYLPATAAGVASYGLLVHS